MDELVVALMEAGLIELEQVAQDGMRVRASAGAASFRREATLREHLYRAQSLDSELPQDSFGHKLNHGASCQGLLEKKLGTAAHLVRKRSDNQLDKRFSLSFDEP